MVNPKKRDLDIAKKVKLLFSRRIPIAEFRMYGSRARGTATWESDLDLYVEVDSKVLSKEQQDYITDITFEVGLKEDILISPFVITKDRSKKQIFQRSFFYQNVQEEGITI